MSDIDKKVDLLNWKKSGILPVVVQEIDGEVLTLAYMNRTALKKTIKTGLVHYYSRSKERIRMKGEVSGNVQRIESVKIDCDNDSLLIEVDQKGPACHTGHRSCFYRELGMKRKNKGKIDYSLNILKELEGVINKRDQNPKNDSYTTYLLEEGEEEIYKKLGEELVEILVAENKENIIKEAADLIYHLLVLLKYEDIELGEVMQELKRRRK